MIQTLLTIASIVVLSGAILTSALVSARNALHRAVVAKTQTAMTDATSEFTFWAQQFVAEYGTEANWNAHPMPVVNRPMCASGVNCAYNATITWKITGATIGVQPANAVGQAVSVVQNMAPAVDEQRISATISVGVSDATGRRDYGGRTEEVTARVFNARPYVVITGVRDLSSDVGVVRDSEGDSGGNETLHSVAANSTPNPLRPYQYTDTVIRTTLDCVNTRTFDESDPNAIVDHGFGTGLIDHSIRTGGAQSWAYQLPCTPTYGVSAAPAAITNYIAPIGSVYQIDASNRSSNWQKGDQSSSTIPR